MALPALATVTVTTPADARTEPSVTVDAAVFASSDPLLLSGGGTGAVMFEIAASPSLRITTQRGSTIDLGGTLRRREYSRRYGNFLLGDARMEVRHRDSEYLTFGGSAGFDRSLALDLMSTSADAAIDPGAIRSSWFAALDAAWRPNAYELFMPEVRLDRAFYPNSDLLLDSRTVTIGLAYSVRSGPRTRLGLRVRDAISTVSGMSNVNSLAAYGTLNRRLGERASLLFEVGLERTGRQVEWLDGVNNRRPGRTLAAGRINLCREASEPPRGLSGCLAGTLDTEVSGVGGLRRNAAVSVMTSLPLNEKFILRGSAEYRRSTLVGRWQSTGPPDAFRDGATDAVRSSVDLDWKLRRDFTVTGSAQYLRRQLVTGQRIGAAYFGIQLSYQPSFRR